MKAAHKFHAKPTTINSIRFDSKLEAKYYAQLLLLKRAGEVIGFLRQVPLHFECGSTYRLDFLVFLADGSCQAIEVKGMETPEYKIKKKLIDLEYPWLDLKVVTA